MGFYHHDIGTDSRVDYQWYLKRCGVFNAHKHTKGDNSLSVAIIDIGFERHDEFIKSIEAVYDINDSFSKNWLNDLDNYTNWGGWHGTRCASLIAARKNNGFGISGVAPDCNIICINADENGIGLDAYGLTQCLNFCVSLNVDVISISVWTNDFVGDSGLITALNNCETNGITVFMAGADQHINDSSDFSNWDYVVPIAGIGKNDEKYPTSAYGNAYTITAPYSDIISYSIGSPSGTGSYGEVYGQVDSNMSVRGGNSYGAPIIAGIAALVKSIDTSLTPSEIRQILTSSLDRSDDANFYNYFPPFAGIINAVKAILKTKSELVGNANVAFPYIGFKNKLSGSKVYGTNCTTFLDGAVNIELGGFSQENITRVALKLDDTEIHVFSPVNNALEEYIFDTTLYSWREMTVEVVTASGTFSESYSDIRGDNVQVMKYHGETSVVEIDDHWHLKYMDVFHAWQHTRGSAVVNTCIIDTGVCYSLDEFNWRLPNRLGYHLENQIAGSQNNCGTSIEFQDNHGTVCANMMVSDHYNGNTAGINQHSTHYTVVDIGGMNFNEYIHPYEYYGAINDLFDLYNIRISSYQFHFAISKTGAPSSIWDQTDAEAWETNLSALKAKGHAHFALSHNSGYNVDGVTVNSNGWIYNYYPTTSSPSAIIVGGSDQLDTWGAGGVNGSNYGSPIDIVAPWTNLPASNTDGTYSMHGGTSFATPMAAGVGSLVFSINPDLTVDEMEQILKDTSDPFGDDVTSTYFPNATGRINAGKAVTKALTTLSYNTGKVFPYIKFKDKLPSCAPNDIKTELTGDLTFELLGFSSDSIEEVSLSFDGQELYRGSSGEIGVTTTYTGESKELTISAKAVGGEEQYLTFTDVHATTLVLTDSPSSDSILKDTLGSNSNIRTLDGNVAQLKQL